MAKNKSKRGADGDGAGGADRIPAALKEFGQKAADLAQNPVARSVIAAGLVTAAAALTANQKVRDTARKTARDAADATEEAAANATRVGEALVTAAADTFRKLFNLDEPAGGNAARGGGQEQTLTTPARRSAGKPKTGARKAAAGKKAPSAKAGAKKTAAKPQATGAAKTKAAGAKSGGARKKAAAPTDSGSGTGSSGA